jgi:hypothetical protein
MRRRPVAPGAGAGRVPPARWATRACAALLVACAALPVAWAAPRDALLEALPASEAGRGWLQVSADHADRSLNPFQDRAVDPSAPRLPPGSVDGQHLGLNWQATDVLGLSASLGRQRLFDGLDHYRFESWLLAVQARVREPDGAWPTLSLRLAAWGDRADRMLSRTPVQVTGAVLSSVEVSRPSDRNLQADLLAGWRLRPTLTLNAVLSLGRTQLAYADLAATTTLDGCHYDLDFNGNEIFGNLSGPCSAAGGVVTQFLDRSGDYGVDVPRELAWRGHFAQLGVNTRWQRGDWTLAGGYLVHRIWRRDVDDIAASRGDPVQTLNHLLAFEAGWRAHRHLSLFVRGQRSSRLFFNELPVIYNSSTSGSFGQHFSLLTLGLRAHF